MNSKDMAYWNDKRLMDLATYYESQGLMYPIETQEQLSNRFIDFKRLIKKGSFTIDELEDRVYSKYGIMDTFRKPISLQEMLHQTKEMTQELKKREGDGKAEKKEKEK
jgi:hypothetical protein